MYESSWKQHWDNQFHLRRKLGWLEEKEEKEDDDDKIINYF